MDEKTFQNEVIDLAKMLGYRVMHSRPAMSGRGRWATHIQGHAGFPDLVLVGHMCVHFMELKSDSGRLSAEQAEWGAALNPIAIESDHVTYGVYRPADLQIIADMLGEHSGQRQR